VRQLPVDELPNGLPLFNVFLHVPAYSARLQLFRLVHSHVIDRFTLHTLLVHPHELDAVPELAGAPAFLQLHGEVWLLDGDGSALTLRRAGQPVAYTVAPSPRGGPMCLLDAAGRRLDEEETGRFRDDDAVKVRFLRECFLREYADDALSVPLVRAYPGLTSLIRRGREFPRLFASDPVGPATEVRDLCGVKVGGSR
jgi:hypothetical protein